MELKQLSYFVAVVEEGSITAAARRLYMSQPPITAQMKALEEELGCTLLLRGARSVRPTDEGRLLYDRAKTLLAMHFSAKEEIAAHVASGSGTLRLGAVSSVASSLLPGWLTDFHAVQPNVRFELNEDNTYRLLDQLRAGVIEMALVRTPFAQERLRVMELSGETLVAAGREGMLPEGEALPLHDLAERPLLLYRRWEQIAGRLFAEQGLTPRILLKSDSADTIAACAAQGLGVGLLPQSAARRLQGEGLRVRAIHGGAVQTAITAVCLAHAALSPAASAFWEYLRAHPAAPQGEPF